MATAYESLATSADRAAPWLASIAVLWPLFVYRYAASYDLPFHEEIVAALRYHADPSRYPPGFFEWRPGLPNQLFYYLAWPLSYVVPVHAACTVVLGASVAGILLGGARLADHLGRSRWVSVAIAPMAFGYLFNRGFVGNVLGVALFLALLPSFDRFAARPTMRGALHTSVAFLFLDLAHESALTFAMLAVVVLSAGHPLRLKGTLVRAVPPTVGAAAILIVHAVGNRLGGPEIRSLARVIRTPLVQKNDELPRMLLGMHNPDRMEMVVVAVGATLALQLIDAFRARKRVTARALGAGANAVPFRFVLLGLLLGSAYYAMPWAIDGATWINQRYLTPAVIVLAIALSPPARVGPSPVTRTASAVAVWASVALALPAFATTTASLSELDRLIPLIAPGSAVGNAAMYGPAPRTYVFSVGGAVTRVTAARGGRTPSSFLHDSPIPPLVIAPAYRWDDLELHNQGMALRPEYDLRKLRYFLVWLMTDAVPDTPITRALAPDARFIARSGGWVLYESTHDVVPIASPEPQVPAGAETLVRRLSAAARPSP